MKAQTRFGSTVLFPHFRGPRRSTLLNPCEWLDDGLEVSAACQRMLLFVVYNSVGAPVTTCRYGLWLKKGDEGECGIEIANVRRSRRSHSSAAKA